MRARQLNTILYAVGATLAVLTVLCGPASAAKRPHASFTVTAEGTETGTAKQRAEGETCPEGMANENVTFTGRPVLIRVEEPGNFLALVGLSLHGEDARQPFTISGMVTRSTSGSFVCRDEAPLDCGAKPFSGLGMVLQGFSARRGHSLGLSVSLRAEDPPDVFRNCPAPIAFPDVFLREGPEPRVAASTLFDRRRHTIVLTASRSNGEAGVATVQRTLTLKLTLRRL